MREAFVEIFKCVRESIRPVVMILILTALALFLPHTWLYGIGIGDWLQTYRPWVILLFAGSSIWLATFPVERLYKIWRMRRRLRNLAGDEKHVLRTYVQNAKTTQAFGNLNIGVAKSLAMRGLLVEVHAAYNGGFPHFRIVPSAFSYLKKRPELLDIPPQSSN